MEILHSMTSEVDKNVANLKPGVTVRLAEETVFN